MLIFNLHTNIVCYVFLKSMLCHPHFGANTICRSPDQRSSLVRRRAVCDPRSMVYVSLSCWTDFGIVEFTFAMCIVFNPYTFCYRFMNGILTDTESGSKWGVFNFIGMTIWHTTILVSANKPISKHSGDKNMSYKDTIQQSARESLTEASNKKQRPTHNL